MNIKIGSREIGEGQPPYIVAEIGSNWQTFEDCITSINLAKNCGADGVKFQLYNAPALYGNVPPELFPEGVMDPSWIPKLKTHCDAMGIEFMCSAFSPELLEVVNPYVNAHKVASAELTHVRMLQKLAQYKKPVILSTGASGDEDIKRALAALGCCPVILLYCVAAYPARSVRLDHIDDLRNRFGHLVGFSDHTTDTYTSPSCAIEKHRACLIEKHVNFVDVRGPDSAHSLSTEEFRNMVQGLKGVRSLARQSPEERDMLIRHNRRIIAIRDIKPGEQLIEGKTHGIFRSLREDTHAFSPWMADEINGRTALKEIQAGCGIGPGDV